MKKITYLLLILSIFSCKNDKKEAETASENIEVKKNAEYINIEVGKTVSDKSNNFSIK